MDQKSSIPHRDVPPEIAMAAVAFASTLIFIAAASMLLPDTGSYTGVLLGLCCAALLAGTIAGTASSCSGGFRLFLLCLPASCVLAQFTPWGMPGFDTRQYYIGMPLVLAATMAMAARTAAISRKRGKYRQLSQIALIGVILCGSLELMSYFHIGGPPGWTP